MHHGPRAEGVELRIQAYGQRTRAGGDVDDARRVARFGEERVEGVGDELHARGVGEEGVLQFLLRGGVLGESSDAGVVDEGVEAGCEVSVCCCGLG